MFPSHTASCCWLGIATTSVDAVISMGGSFDLRSRARAAISRISLVSGLFLNASRTGCGASITILLFFEIAKRIPFPSSVPFMTFLYSNQPHFSTTAITSTPYSAFCTSQRDFREALTVPVPGGGIRIHLHSAESNVTVPQQDSVITKWLKSWGGPGDQTAGEELDAGPPEINHRAEVCNHFCLSICEGKRSELGHSYL